MNHYEIAQKLLGPINAVGDSHTDAQRTKNLDATFELVDLLVRDIFEAAATRNRQEASMATIGKKATAYLLDLQESLDECILE